MNSKRGKIILLHLICLLAIGSFAQDFSYKMFTIKSGLSGSEVINVFQDHRGYLWISTEGGLSRYDGNTFKNYTLASGLPSNYITFDFEDSLGNIWFHYKDGVCYFDGTRFIANPIHNPPKNIWINQVLCTKNKEKFFVTDKQIFELQDGMWKRFDLFNMNRNSIFRNIIELGDHTFLINCLDSLVISSANSTYHIIAYPVKKEQTIQWVYFIDGTYYIITHNHLYVFRNNHLELIHDDVLANAHVSTIFMDRNHRLWVGTLKHGIYVFSGEGYAYINPTIESLHTGKIYLVENFCEDREGNIWAATTSGLMKIRPSWVEIYNLQNDRKGVRSSFKDQYGRLYFGQTAHGFMVRKNNDFISSDSLLDRSSKKRLRNWIGGFACDEQKHLWLTDNNGNLLRIKGRHAEIMNDKLGLSLLPYGTHIIFNPLDCTVYVGSANGLTAIRNNKAHEDTLFNKGEDRINSLAVNSAGNIWIGTEKGKILEKQGSKNVLKSQDLGLDKVHIAKIKSTDPNELWVASEGGGIYKFHRSPSGPFQKDFHISSADGLTNDHVIDYALEKVDKLWIITLGGLSSVQFYKEDGKQSFAITNYGEEDGFNAGFFLYSSLIRGDDGYIWLATENYIAKIHGDQIEVDTVPPIMHIENVKLLNSDAEWVKYASHFSSFFHLPENPVIPYSKNDIAIDYAAISFNNNGNTTYSYKLEGLDKEWNNNGKRTELTLGKLSPGNYLLKVRAKKPLSSWSYDEFAFTISPPWWGTNWFRILATVLLVYMGYSVYRFLLKQHLAKIRFEMQVLEERLQERLRISRELHDDVGSTLGSISIYSEVAKISNENRENTEEALTKIGKTSRELIDKLNDIVWSLDSSKDNFVQLENRMKTFLAMTLTSQDLMYDFIVADEIETLQLTREQRKNIFLIFKEAVYNVVKYAECKKVQIILTMENKMFNMLIGDNGKGFDINLNNLYTGNGIKNMHSRARDMNATLIVDSKINEGTTILLRITL
jgi:signal transduction histidine kinase/ligand-binding sensor domain-containing protein